MIHATEEMASSIRTAKERREEALQQAHEVLQSMEEDGTGEAYLDEHYFLPIVASNITLSSSHHHNSAGPSSSSTTTAAAAASSSTATATTSTSYNFLMETTLSQVSEWTEAYLEDWSRTILDEGLLLMTTTSSSEPVEADSNSLAAAKQVNIEAIQKYIQSCGPEVERFRQDSDDENDTLQMEDKSLVPTVFYSDSFQLTDSQTFQELFIDEDIDTSSAEKLDFLDIPVQEWFPIVPPDSFGTCLDRVELELLHQVRSQSTAFFEESNRFANLQNSIHELLVQVTELQRYYKESLQPNVVKPLRTIPETDIQRQYLVRLNQFITLINDILDAKQSIIYYLQHNDDTTVIEFIQQTRHRFEQNAGLQQIEALAKLPRQLDQYEQLVASKLRDELVDIFLGNTSLDTERIQSILRIWKSTSVPLQQILDAYQTRWLDMTRLTVRTVVGEFDSQGASAMSLGTFMDCLDMTFEQLIQLFTVARRVNEYLIRHEIKLSTEPFDRNENDEVSSNTSVIGTPLGVIISENAELSGKLVSDLLKVRKESHSLISLNEMKRIWSKCLTFCEELESMLASGRKVVTLRSTLVGQAKYFLERKHEGNMSSLAAALDSERWTQCDVSQERQNMITRLCTGRSLVATPMKSANSTDVEKKPEAEIEGTRYKVVWSCLLLVEMILENISAATHFNSLATNVVTKTAELLRLFNSRTTSLVLGAGAIHSTAKLKSINAKHLSIVTQCLGLILSMFPHVKAALIAQMPERQHNLLSDLDAIKKEYNDHNEKVLNKFASIIGDIIEHSLAPKIGTVDFDKRSKEVPMDDESCSVFFEGVQTNIRKMHQVLRPLLPPSHLIDVFSRIYALVDQKIPSLLDAAQSPGSPKRANARPLPAFVFPKSNEGKKRLLLELEMTTKTLNSFEGVQAWEFTAIRVLERQLDFKLSDQDAPSVRGSQVDDEIDSNGLSVGGSATDDSNGMEGANNQSKPSDDEAVESSVETKKSEAPNGENEVVEHGRTIENASSNGLDRDMGTNGIAQA